MARRYGSKRMTKTHNRTALRSVLVMREKPLTDADKVSLARSYGVTVEDVEKMARQVAND